MLDLNSAALMKDEIRRETCKGLVFRLSITQHYFVDDHKRIIWVDRTVMRQLKMDSCPGCRHCGYLHEYLDEFTTHNDIQIRPRINPGAKYELKVVDISRDPETGVVDDWSLAFVEIEEDEECK